MPDGLSDFTDMLDPSNYVITPQLTFEERFGMLGMQLITVPVADTASATTLMTQEVLTELSKFGISLTPTQVTRRAISSQYSLNSRLFWDGRETMINPFYEKWRELKDYIYSYSHQIFWLQHADHPTICFRQSNGWNILFKP